MEVGANPNPNPNPNPNLRRTWSSGRSAMRRAAAAAAVAATARRRRRRRRRRRCWRRRAVAATCSKRAAMTSRALTRCTRPSPTSPSSWCACARHTRCTHACALHVRCMCISLHVRCMCMCLYVRRMCAACAPQVGVLCGVALGACVKEPRTAERAVLALATLGSVAMTALAVPPRCRKRRLARATATARLPWPSPWDAGLGVWAALRTPGAGGSPPPRSQAPWQRVARPSACAEATYSRALQRAGPGLACRGEHPGPRRALRLPRALHGSERRSHGRLHRPRAQPRGAHRCPRVRGLHRGWRRVAHPGGGPSPHSPQSPHSPTVSP